MTRSTKREFNQRLFNTFLLLLIVAFVSRIPLPTAKPEAMAMLIKTKTGLDLIGFCTFGLLPFFGSSLIIQVATPLVPFLRRWRNAGMTASIWKAQLFLTVLLCIIQGHMLLGSMGSASVDYYPNLIDIANASIFWPRTHLLSIGLICLGTLFCVGMGRLITRRGIGNGIALILALYAVAPVTDALHVSLNIFQTNPGANAPSFIVLIILFALVLMGTVAIFLARSEVKVMYADGTRPGRLQLPVLYSGFLPLIITQAALMYVPQFLIRPISSLLGLENTEALSTFLSMESPTYIITFALVLILISIYWARVEFSARRVALYLAEDGGRIDGCEPGQETANFLRKKVDRLNFAGTLTLAILSLLPLLLINAYNIPFVIAQFYGGIGLMVPVAVGVDVWRTWQAHRTESVSPLTPA